MNNSSRFHYDSINVCQIIIFHCNNHDICSSSINSKLYHCVSLWLHFDLPRWLRLLQLFVNEPQIKTDHTFIELDPRGIHDWSVEINIEGSTDLNIPRYRLFTFYCEIVRHSTSHSRISPGHHHFFLPFHASFIRMTYSLLFITLSLILGCLSFETRRFMPRSNAQVSNKKNYLQEECEFLWIWFSFLQCGLVPCHNDVLSFTTNGEEPVLAFLDRPIHVFFYIKIFPTAKSVNKQWLSLGEWDPLSWRWSHLSG